MNDLPRYIMLMGTDWKAILGERAEYIPRQVGIALVGGGNDSYEKNLRNMQVMSGNVDIAMPVLIDIVSYFCEAAGETVKINSKYKRALEYLEKAKLDLEIAGQHYQAARKSKI